MFVGNITGTGVQQLGNRWGPYLTHPNSSDQCYVHVVRRLHDYKKLDPEFLVGVDTKNEVRFICDIPVSVDNALPEYSESDPITPKGEENKGTLDGLFQKIVEEFCKPAQSG